MRMGVRVLVVLVVLVMGAGPASAGTKAKPELVDRCDGQVQGSDNGVEVIHETVDLCKVWFSKPSARVLDISLSTSGSLEDRPGGLYFVGWRAGQCSYNVTIDDSVRAEVPRQFGVDCGEPPKYECPVFIVYCEPRWMTARFPLKANSVTVSGTVMRIRLSFTGPLAKYRSVHDQGSVLTTPGALTSLAIGPTYFFTFGCAMDSQHGNFCMSANGDMATNGRSYRAPK